MKKRVRIPKSLVEKYIDDICFIVETKKTYIEAIKPRVMYVELLGYEVRQKLIDGYVKGILEFHRYDKFDRWWTYGVKMSDVQQKLTSRETKRKVDSVMRDNSNNFKMRKKEWEYLKKNDF